MFFNRLFPLLLLLFLYSCKNSSSVVGKSGFQKRKYQKGWHIEGRSSLLQNQKTKEECLSENIVPVELDEIDTLTHVVPESNTETFVEAQVSPIVPFIKELIAVNSQAVFASEKSFGQTDFGVKKKKSKRRKEKFNAYTRTAQSVFILSYWGYDWPFYKNFIGMTLSGLGIVLSIYAITKLKKNQKRNKRMCYFLLFANTLVLIMYLFVF